MNGRRVRAGVLSAVLGLGCGGGASNETLAPRLEGLAGRFAYRAFDGRGDLLLVGTITLQAVEDSRLAGTWEIRWAVGADTTAIVGPQVGTGTLGGRVGPDQTLIDLNPGWADNNVYLFARTAGDGDLTGRWQHSTLIGPVAEGRFELRRRTD
jgi:hypothetical protein